MISLVLRRRIRLEGGRAGEKNRGESPALVRMSQGRAVGAQIQNVRMLPCAESNSALQNAAGDFYFLPGWSDPAGTDTQISADNDSLTADDETHTMDED